VTAPRRGVSPRRARGIAGEDRAAAWYEAGGYEVVARNWRCRDGEVDLIVAHGSTIVFCEVKSRASADFGLPAEAVTPVKQARLRRLAAQWLETSGRRPREVRFDVAAVLGDELEVIPDAF
jgi:putative endonuclease